MRNLNKHQERSISIVGLKIEGVSPENTDNVRQAMVMLLRYTNPEIFKDEKSPQEILHLLGFSIPNAKETEETKKTGKGRWAKMVERSKKIRMSSEASQIMEEASKQFREEFAFNHDLEKK